MDIIEEEPSKRPEGGGHSQYGRESGPLLFADIPMWNCPSPPSSPCCPHVPVHGWSDKTGHLSLEPWFSKCSYWGAYWNASFLENHRPSRLPHLERQLHVSQVPRMAFGTPSLRTTTEPELWCALAASELGLLRLSAPGASPGGEVGLGLGQRLPRACWSRECRSAERGRRMEQTRRERRLHTMLSPRNEESNFLASWL